MTTRKLSKAIGLVSLMIASSAMSVGLGEIQLNSALSEPLDAKISLLSVDGLEASELLVSLASREDFNRAGVTREFFLTQLRFEVDLSEAGDPVISVYSEEPIVEPYLDFLVQLQWPSGRLLREYTLLLDLPIYTGEKKATKQISRASSGDKVAVPKPASESKPQATTSQSRQPRQRLTGDEYRVASGDTLWGLAKRVRPEDASIKQTMDVLYENNQHAFINGNINLLKQGSVLRLPSTAEIHDADGSVVTSRIASDAPKPAEAPQLSAVEQQKTEQPSTQNSARLELASATDDAVSLEQSEVSAEGTPGGGGSTSGVAQLSNELAIAQDEVNKVQRENAELRERLALLEEQVSTMATLVDVQNEGLVAAQKEVQQATQGDQASASQASTEKPSVGQTPIQTSAEKPLPWYLWLGGALAAALLALLVILGLRSKGDKKEPEEELTLEGYQDLEEHKKPQKAESVVALDDLDDLELNPEDQLFEKSTDNKGFFDEDETTTGSDEELSESLVDVVSEAEIYLSLGNTDQAIEILEEAREADPADTACRLKLMEVLFKQDRKDELKPLFLEIKDAGDTDATAMAAVIMGPVEEPVNHLDADVDNEALLEGDLQAEAEEDINVESEESAPDGLDLDLGGLGEAEVKETEIEESLEGSSSVEADTTDESEGTADESLVAGAGLAVETDATGDVTDSSEELDLGDLSDLEGMSELADFNEVDTKLDLAKTYLEMGDPEGARGILEEVVAEADEEGKNRAQKMLDDL